MASLDELVGESPAIRALRDRIDRVLRTLGGHRPPPVLIQGETGTGKGLLAQILHRAGPRAAGRFVAVNCAAIPETLIEAELFGFERGAFTDARQSKPGLLMLAHGGTLFLDEVGLLPEGVQGKLLKAIEDREVRRLGGTRSEPVHAWIIAATSEDLGAARRDGRFQEAFYQRLSVLTFELPPLRERGSDVLALAERFLAQACADYRLAPKRLAPDALAALGAYAWPGNVREVANVMERVALLSPDTLVTAAQLALPEPAPGVGGHPGTRRGPAGLADPRGSLGAEDILAALRETGWNISRAAARLGIPRNTLRYRIEKHGLRPGTPGAAPALAPPVAAATGPATSAILASVRWERQRVTLLRAVLSGAPDPAGLLDRHELLDLVVAKVGVFGGRLEELSASGLVAAFGLEPVEDAPRRAGNAALAIHRALERAGAGPGVGVTLAVHVGEFVLGRAGGTSEMVLEEKQEAWRVLQALIDAAAPGDVHVSAAAGVLLESGFELGPGRGGPSGPTYRLLGMKSLDAGRRLARFVGRSAELDFLRSQLVAVTRGAGRVVGIVGEPGIGKTRLLAEFHQDLAPDRATYLEAHCVSYGSAIPHLPLLDHLRGQCGIVDSDTPETVADKVRAALERLGLVAADGTPYLLHLLGVKDGADELGAVSAEALQTRAFETLRQMSLRASGQRPLVLAVENLHWIDRTSEEYLASLVESLASARILLLLTYRHGYQPPWMGKSYATQIALHPLAADDSIVIVESVLRSAAVPDPVAREVLARAEGNPFFLEELALAVRERGVVEAALAIPSTIQDVLLARISQLPDEPKWLLQTASVLGREVPLRLLRAIWKGPGGMETPLRELTRLEFLYEQTGTDERVYAFKHALTRDVAYTALVPSRRRDLHGAAARALETLHADRLGEIQDRLAYHYSHTEDAARAVHHLRRLAERAARTYAHVEAVAALAEALRHAERLPGAEGSRARVELTLGQAHSLYFLGRFAETRDLLVRRRAEVEAVDDPALAGPYYFWLGHTESLLGNHAEADRCAERALAEAGRADDRVTLGQAWYVRARAGFWSGRFVEAAAHARQAVTHLDGTAARWWLGFAHWAVAFSHGFLGDFATALEAADRTRAIGEAIEDPRLETYAAWTTGWLQATMGDWEAGIRACRQSLERSPDPVNTADALSFLGGAYLEGGAAAAAGAALEEAVDRWRQFQHGPMLAWFTVLLGEARFLAGDAGRGHDLVREGLEIARGVGFGFAAAWAERALGRVVRAVDAVAADGHAQAALAGFARLEARFEVARTRLDLAPLAADRGDRAGAAGHLQAAAELFAALGVPRYQERVQALAAALGLPLGPVPG